MHFCFIWLSSSPESFAFSAVMQAFIFGSRADLSADAAGAPLLLSPFGFGDEGLVVGDVLEFVGGVVCANAKVVALNAIKATRAEVR
jgi:hypothetical protein